MIPKFRAWHKEKKLMRELDAIFFDFKSVISSGLKFPMDIEPIKNNEWPFNEIELMQWTGLQDKNGTDIYQGDIIGGPIGLRRGYICYGEHLMCSNFYISIMSYGFHIKFPDETRSLNYIKDCDLLVIGNIYLNPELLT